LDPKAGLVRNLEIFKIKNKEEEGK
jgi:hypothetical protein